MSLGESIGPFRLIEALGQGSRCSTYLAEAEEDGAGSITSSTSNSQGRVVIKILRGPTNGEPCMLDEEKAQWAAASQLLPPQARLVRLAGESVKEEEEESDEEAGSSGEYKGDGQRSYLVTAPYCSGGSLEELLQSSPRSYDLSMALRWAVEVAQALYLLHTTTGVRRAHGRVCARNVLLRDGEAWLRGPGASMGGEAEEEKGGEEESAAAWAEASVVTPGASNGEAQDVRGWARVVLSLLSRSWGGAEATEEEVVATWRRTVEGVEEEEDEEDDEGAVVRAVLQLLSACMSSKADERPSMRAVLCRLVPLADMASRRQALTTTACDSPTNGGLLSRLPGLARRRRTGSVGGAAAVSPAAALAGVLQRPEEELELVSMEEKLRAMRQKGGRGVVVDEEVMATLLWNKAVLHKRLGEVESAAACLHAALQGVDRGASPLAVYCMSELAALCKVCGDTDRALSLYEDALRLGRKALPSGHPDLARFMHNLSMVYYGHGDYDHALTLLEEALGLKRRSLPPGDPEIATSLANIAMVHEAKGNHIRATQMAEVALRLRRAALPPTHPHILSSLDCLAVIYRAGGQYSQALPLCEEALSLRRQVLHPLDPDMARSLSNLAALYEAKGEDAKAVPLLEEALQVRTRALPPDHPDTATSLNNLAGRYRSLGQLDRALSLYSQALAIRRRTLPTGHADLVSSLHNLATVHRARGEYDLAAEYDDEASQSPGSTSPFNSTGGSSAASLLAFEKLSGLGTKMERVRRHDEQELSFSAALYDYSSSPSPAGFLAAAPHRRQQQP